MIFVTVCAVSDEPHTVQMFYLDLELKYVWVYGPLATVIFSVVVRCPQLDDGPPPHVLRAPSRTSRSVFLRTPTVQSVLVCFICSRWSKSLVLGVAVITCSVRI